MEIDDGVFRIVPSSSIDNNVINLVVKCQVAAVDGLEKKVKTMNSKLKDWEVQAQRTTMFHTLFMLAIVTIRMLLTILNLRAPSSVTVYKELLDMCMVVWVVVSLIALFKLTSVHNLASEVRGKKNDLRSSAIILQGKVEEDFRTNEGARCFTLYSLTLLRIRSLFVEIGFYDSDMKWLAVFSIVAPVLVTVTILCLGL
ncbi:hypothetical protein LIER_22632 [Lithospermum erythrorhizon]|uniref:Uncharacterized protein n=1 Tax=Lithospermum erythrorhizon TaxID=34254 RepID=A0AAV3QXM3_LITER